jgi:acetoin utilization deacetylase AcuC-like enzyme
MAASRVTAVVEDPRFLDHCGPSGHPECPDRLIAVRDALAPRRDSFESLAPRLATPDEIQRIHGPDHLEGIARVCARAPAQLDADTYVCSESLEIALLAAGSSIDLVRRVAAGRAQAGLAAIRPPGHHAEADRAMGFCLINNVAVATRALQAEDGVERVLILDWDVHHGNGSQHSFEDDPSVLYVSTHQFPYYPGTGAASENGRGKGSGYTLNVPMPAGCGDAEYIGVFQRILVPAAQQFRPDFMLISCGFDAHADDPLADMQLSGAGFAAMSAIVRQLAEELCGGRIAFLLEGGYALSGVREGTAAVLDAMLDATAPELPATVDLSPGSRLDRILAPVIQVHRGNFPNLGAS